MHALDPGDVLVTTRTDPDWEPIMRRAAAIVTDSGGRTCHAAIIARELGVPCIVGTIHATKTLLRDSHVTVDCSQGEEGIVWPGLRSILITEMYLDDEPADLEELDNRDDLQPTMTAQEETTISTSIPSLAALPYPTRVMLTLGNPSQAFTVCSIPGVAGVGLARLEFIIANTIGIHPSALLDLEKVEAPRERRAILEGLRRKGYGAYLPRGGGKGGAGSPRPPPEDLDRRRLPWRSRTVRYLISMWTN